MTTSKPIDELLRGLTFEDDLIEVSKLQVDLSYQRPISWVKVRQIANAYSEQLAGLLFVNVRPDGGYFVCDGQHRLESIKLLEQEFAPCRVFRGLSIEVEARIFVICNTTRKAPDLPSIFKAQLAYEDATALELVRIVEAAGYQIQLTHGGTRSNNGIWAINALYDIFNQGGEELLTYLLALIKTCWPDEPLALRGEFMGGLRIFHQKYAGKYDVNHFIEKMKLTDIKALRSKAAYHHAEGRMGIHLAYATALQQAYDYHKKGRRLVEKEG